MVDSLLHLGKVSREKWDYEEAMESLSAAHQLLKGLEGDWGIVECLRSLAAIQGNQVDPLMHIQCLIRLVGALEPIEVPGPDEFEPIHEVYWF
ncbi:hypothetical protein FRB95_011169 [Tulasnella sp. JGI-2019a]|nr:hypothetical protein FRB95_011169 [Tulasnella sp. JGI-2019a]